MDKPDGGAASRWKGSGAARGIRTPDPIITNDVLYQLSYAGHGMGGAVYRVACGATTAGGNRRQTRLRTRMTTSTLSSTVPSGNRGIALISNEPGSTSRSSPVSTL